MCCASGTAASEVEDRLRDYVDERVQQLRAELLAVLQGHSKAQSNWSKATAPAEEDPCDVLPQPLSGEHLDRQNTVETGESIWDCVTFIGLDCIGPAESVLMALLLFMNYVVQIYFCTTVLIGGMTENPLNNDVLNELLRFRTRVAHNVEHADLVSGRSLLSQVCNGEERLHISGTQRRMNEDIESFESTGNSLVLLALLCWSASVLAEVTSTLRYALAIWERRGASTCISLMPSGRFLMKSLRSLDVAKVFVLTVVPRLTIACLLYYVGVLYLSRTSRPEDLLLNAMALAFIMDLDELFFAALVPHRIKSLVRGVEPMPLATPSRNPLRRAYKWCAPLQLLVLVLSLVLLYFAELVPFRARMAQASDILCSGQQDFVYSLDPASGMVVATRSAADESWTETECTVLQLARPRLRLDFGWSPPGAHCSNIPDLAKLSESTGRTAALLRPTHKTAMQEIEFARTDFDFVSSLSKADVLQASKHATCVDLVSPRHKDSAIFLTSLQEAVSVGVAVSSCDNVAPFCHFQNMTRVRALCPQTCQCNMWGFTVAGFFKTAAYGCPEQCHVEAIVSEERLTADGFYPLECKDFTNTWHFSPINPIGLTPEEKFSLMDSNNDGNLSITEVTLGFMHHVIRTDIWVDLFHFDLNDDGVWDASEQSFFEVAYAYIRDFDNDNDGSLSAAEAQDAVATRGGSDVTLEGYVDANGDGLLTASEMAGHPRGSAVVAPPFPTRITADTSVSRLFILGLFEYLWSRPNFVQHLEQSAALLASYLRWTETQKAQVVQYFLTEGAGTEWIQGYWVLAPSVQHPRGLVWCEFITSWELVLLVGVDLCTATDVTSVRTFCPESCSCHAGMTDCPGSCPNIHEIGSARSLG